MALSRIWSAFIIVAVLVAAGKWIFSGDETIFNRMVVGRADDATDSTRYIMIGHPHNAGYSSDSAFIRNLGTYNYAIKDSVQKANLLITDDPNSDTVRNLKSGNTSIKVYTFKSIQWRLIRKADGIIE